jgi:hypothetical protein
LNVGVVDEGDQFGLRGGLAVLHITLQYMSNTATALKRYTWDDYPSMIEVYGLDGEG